MLWIWDVQLLVSPGERDWVLRLVKVLGIGDGAIICSDRHDTLGYKLLLLLVFRDSPPTKDGSNGLGGILVCRALVLASLSTLTILGLIVVARTTSLMVLP